MTARDDYPALAWWCDPEFASQVAAALDEIDLLRAAVAKYGSTSRSQTERRP